MSESAKSAEDFKRAKGRADSRGPPGMMDCAGYLTLTLTLTPTLTITRYDGLCLVRPMRGPRPHRSPEDQLGRTPGSSGRSVRRSRRRRPFPTLTPTPTPTLTLALPLALTLTLALLLTLTLLLTLALTVTITVTVTVTLTLSLSLSLTRTLIRCPSGWASSARYRHGDSSR